MCGEENDSEVIELMDLKRKIFQRGGIDSFIFGTTR
jgi:hypothetical protein